MNVPSGLSVGVCSHTGLVRGGNEDDFLLVTPPGDQPPSFVAAIADGMGGVAGGAEASRTALRALVATLLACSPDEDARECMRRGFHAANARVYEAASAIPALRDMGTTLTAVWLKGARAVVGHIGDSRLYRLRDDSCEVLTDDHAVREGESLLTRCIGGGQIECQPDDAVVEVAAGDRLVLATDGVWNVVPKGDLAAIAGVRDAQQAAERLVRLALSAGAPDNATAVVIDVIEPGANGCVELDLPRRERPDARSLWPAPDSLRPPVWSWLLLALSVLLLLWSVLRWADVGVFD